MAIELISTIIPKNNGKFPIVLSNDLKGGIHYADTMSEMLEIPSERLQPGMLCYVGGSISRYFHYVNGEWEPFTVSGGGGGNISDDGSYQRIYRVDSLEDLKIINILYGDQAIKDGNLAYVTENSSLYIRVNGVWEKTSLSLDHTYQRMFRVDNISDLDLISDIFKDDDPVSIGNMAFVKEDGNTYIYLEDGWTNANVFSNKIHIGAKPPSDKTMLWIDTTDDTLIENTVLSSTDNLVLQAILDSIKELRKEVDEIKAIIKNGNITWPDDDEPTEVVTFIIDESGDFFVTEDGDYIIDELIEYKEPENNSKDVICLENGDVFVTEDGDYIVGEDSVEQDDNEEDKPPVVPTGNKVIGEAGDTLITELGEYVIQEI